jgi:hypothetical protein
MSTTDFDPAAFPATAVGPIAVPVLPGRPEVAGRSGDAHLDEFARKAGPDVTFGSGLEMVKVYAIFAIDPDTNRMRVRVVDDTGRLIRMIPADSVAKMIAAMSGYNG